MKILLADDHALFREALRSVAVQLENNVVLLEASDSREAIHLITEHSNNGLVLLVPNLPYLDGFSILTELLKRQPEIAVVILSGALDRDSVVKALDLDALGFIPKSGQREVMMSALQLVLARGISIPSEVLAQGQAALNCSTRPRDASSHPEFTERPLEVLTLVTRDNSNKMICRALNLAEPTVKNRVTTTFGAVKVSNLTEAVISARLQMIPLQARTNALVAVMQRIVLTCERGPI